MVSQMEAPVPRESLAASRLVQQRLMLLTRRGSPLLLDSLNGRNDFAEEFCAQVHCRHGCTTLPFQPSPEGLLAPAPSQAAPKTTQKFCSQDSKALFPLACSGGMARGKRGAPEESKSCLLGYSQELGKPAEPRPHQLVCRMREASPDRYLLGPHPKKFSNLSREDRKNLLGIEVKGVRICPSLGKALVYLYGSGTSLWVPHL